MKKLLLYALLTLFSATSYAQWTSGGTTQGIFTGNKQIRWNFGSGGFVYGYTKGQVDSLKATIIGGVSSVFGRTGAVTAQVGDYSSFYPLFNGTGATGTWGIGITGNAGTVTNGVYTTGSYANPSWINTLAWSKITGAPTSFPTPNSVTFNNSGSGATSGTTFDGSVARTISYNTIGAQPAGNYLVSGNNLSDVANASTSLSNLGGESLSNKTATQSSSTTTYPNWAGVTDYVTTTGGNYVHKTGNESIAGVKTFTDTTKLTKVLIGANNPVGTENVALKSDITNTGNVVTRAGQFYATQQGNQSFTGIDIETNAKNTGSVDHVASTQVFSRFNNTGDLDKAWNYFSVGAKQTGGGLINNAYGYYHAGFADAVGSKFGKKWSFYAAADYMFLSSSSGLAINTFTPAELIDVQNANVNGSGARINNAWIGNWNTAGAFASFGHYDVKSDGSKIAILQDNTGETYLNASAGKSLFFDIGVSNKGRITPNGNWQLGAVSTGTTDTGHLLQVYGTSYLDGIITNTSLTTNTLLMADGTKQIVSTTALPSGITAPNNLQENPYSTSATPSIVAGSALGTGGSLEATILSNSTNQDGILKLTTGSSGTTTGYLGRVTMSGSFAYPHSCAPVLTPNGGTAATNFVYIYVSNLTSTTFDVYTTTALPTNTALYFTYHNGGY